MKNIISNLISTLLIFILLIVIGAVGVIIYLTINEDSNSIIYEFIGEKYVSEENSQKETETKEINQSIGDKLKLLLTDDKEAKQTFNYSAEASQSNFFYEQLNEAEKKIYNGLQENKENMKSGDYTINYGNTFSNILSEQDGSDKLGDYYQSAIEAFTHDNSDLFFINVNKMYLNIETTKKLTKTTYKVYISPKTNENYYADGFSSKEQVEDIFKQLEEEKNKITSTLSGDKYKDIVKIHDYLVDNIEYDQTYNSLGTYSIYGALINKKSVCEGYAKAFKYLLNSVGINCEIVQGEATNSKGESESHAWNAVKLNDKWYLVDVTWDDPIVIGGGTLTIRNKHKYLLKGADTFKTDHKEEYQFTENGKIFSYPEISIYDYK